ncbi:MAG: hypothetical protein PUD59_04215 [bacterium]|nr:hypothetical protein [bacterium]
MFFKGIKKNKAKIQKSSFKLIEVIIVMIITSISSITLTIIVSHTINNTSKKIKTESDLSEVIDTYDAIVNEYYE